MQQLLEAEIDERQDRVAYERFDNEMEKGRELSKCLF